MNETWFDSNRQEYYFDYKIGKPMKEKDQKIIEGLNFEQLVIIDEMLPLYEMQGEDVTELRDKVWEEINKIMSPYAGATKMELINLRLQMQRLEEQDGFDMSSQIEPLSEEIQRRSESGTIYDAQNPSPEVVRHDK